MNRLPTEHTYIERREGNTLITLTGADGKAQTLKADSITIVERRLEDPHAPSMFDPVVIHCTMKPLSKE